MAQNTKKDLAYLLRHPEKIKLGELKSKRKEINALPEETWMDFKDKKKYRVFQTYVERDPYLEELVGYLKEKGEPFDQRDTKSVQKIKALTVQMDTLEKYISLAYLVTRFGIVEYDDDDDDDAYQLKLIDYGSHVVSLVVSSVKTMDLEERTYCKTVRAQKDIWGTLISTFRLRQKRDEYGILRHHKNYYTQTRNYGCLESIVDKYLSVQGYHTNKFLKEKALQLLELDPLYSGALKRTKLDLKQLLRILGIESPYTKTDLEEKYWVDEKTSKEIRLKQICDSSAFKMIDEDSAVILGESRHTLDPERFGTWEEHVNSVVTLIQRGATEHIQYRDHTIYSDAHEKWYYSNYHVIEIISASKRNDRGIEVKVKFKNGEIREV